jgi:hypothetical protein
MSETYKPILIDSIKVAMDVEPYRFLGFDGNYCNAGEKALGVIDVPTDCGQYAPIGISGILLVEANGSITAGAEVASDSTGRAVSATEDDKINGYALENASAGQVIRIVRGI